MMNIEIYDNFLSDDQYKQIHHLMYDIIPYYPTPTTVGGGGIDSFFSGESELLFHVFKGAMSRTISLYYEVIKNIFSFSDNDDVWVIRANLIEPKGFNLRHIPYHVDMGSDEGAVDGYVAIYYLHGNTTPTVFKEGFRRKYIWPKKNRLVIFSNKLFHAHYLPFFNERRVLVFNFRETHPLNFSQTV